MSAFYAERSNRQAHVSKAEEGRIFDKLSPAKNRKCLRMQLHNQADRNGEVFLTLLESDSVFRPLKESVHVEGSFQLVWVGEVYAFSDKPNLHDAWVKPFLELVQSQNLETALKAINGKFALILVDTVKNETVIARDRHGMKTLFYAETEEGLAIGSTIRSILASKFVKPVVDMDGLWHAFSFPAPPQPATCFKHIKALHRGCFARWKEGRLTTHAYYNQTWGSYQDEDLNAASQRLNKTLEESIGKLNHDAEEVATLISGGVDSTYVSAMLSKHHPHLHAYTFGLDPKKYGAMNEVDDARSVAEEYKLNFKPHYFDFDALQKPFKDVIDIYEQPGLHLATNYFLTGMAKDGGQRILFNGLAADEQHGGFHYFQYIDVWKMVKTFPALVYFIPRGGKKKYEDLKNLKLAKTIDEYYAHGFSTLKEFEKKRLFNEFESDSYAWIREAYGNGNRFQDEVEGLLYYMFANVPNHHLYRFEMFSLHHGVEPRYPFLENDVVEVSASIHPKHKVVNRERKVALKHAAKNWVSEDLLFRKKRGLTLPIGDWINGPWKAFVDDHLDGLARRPEFNSKEVHRINRLYRGSNPGKVMKLVMVEVWFRHFIDGGYTD